MVSAQDRIGLIRLNSVRNPSKIVRNHPKGQPAESPAGRGEFPEMTLDEINEEIREVRRLRKERNHS